MAAGGYDPDLVRATATVSHHYVQVQSLSSLLGRDLEGTFFWYKMGGGSRIWGRKSFNDEKTFEEGFPERIKKLISSKYNGTATKSGRYRDGAVMVQRPRHLSKGKQSKLRNVAVEDCESGAKYRFLGGFLSSIQENNNLKALQQSTISRVSTGKSSNLADVLRNSLNNSEIEHVEIEGHLCSKRMLSEWAVKYLRHSILRETMDNSTQTEAQPKPESSSPPLTSNKLIECKPDCADTATETDVINVVNNQCANTSNDTQPNVTQQQPSQGTAAVPSLMGLYVPSSSDRSIYGRQSNDATHQNQLQPTSSAQRYEEAKNWKPKDENQKKAFEQAKTDVYNVLVVCKGCAVKYFKMGERLDLEKIGVPNLETLLVQMGDRIYLKKERFTNNVYIYPNIGADQFEGIAHIGELVAEQRDKEPLPNPAGLVDCDAREFFEIQQPGTLYQNGFYSTANSPYSYANPFQAYTNVFSAAAQQSYYNNYHQIYSSSTNANPGYQQQQQWPSQQSYHPSSYKYNTYNYRWF